jgi:hypothetical protein
LGWVLTFSARPWGKLFKIPKIPEVLNITVAVICIIVAEPYGRDGPDIYMRHPAPVKDNSLKGEQSINHSHFNSVLTRPWVLGEKPKIPNRPKVNHNLRTTLISHYM